MEIPEDLKEKVKGNDLEFQSEPVNGDWYLCTLQRPSGFTLLIEEVRRDQIRSWIIEKLDFLKGGKDWVK